ncbi:DNA methylase [Prosthecomicrobium hirschii]|uniref:site-specific DNA-methyltransferase n=1 Tax=Prosthecodimorpha hirschii TaxID=665126 RepID=UPI0011283BB6|nr:DNA methyltransferase [Prosthecomicrobium hirschii]TPQ51011.1 DNA methylase [Prosthecomicrobium hirschii]
MSNLQIAYRPVGSLIPYARNARTHSDDQIAQIAASIREFGWTNPILIDDDGGIIAGHGRLLAARQLGMAEVPTITLAGLSETQKRALVIADNKLALNAGWDDELLAVELQALIDQGYEAAITGFSEAEIDQLIAAATATETGHTDEDAVPEAPKQPVTRRGDLWLLGSHRLLCGDSTDATDVTRVMAGERAALFATDPPYLVDYDGTNHPTKKGATAKAKKIANKDWSEEYIEQKHWDDSSQGPQFYEAFMATAIEHAIAEDAAWYCWHASRRQAMLEACWDKFEVLHHQQIIWAKSRPVLTRSVLLWAHEPCLFGWRKGNKSRINREGFENWPTTVWSIPSSEIETREHPTSKPVRIFTLPMELHTAPGEVCYEPFSGSGSQLIAGEKTGRRVYGLELSETFCDVIVSRWQAFTGKTATLDGDGRSFDEVKAERLRDDPAEAKDAA